MEVFILVISFIILLGIGLPIAWSIGLSSLFTMLVSIPALSTFTTIAQRMATGLDSFSLLAIPFFILGGLAHVNIVAAMLFGAIAGSAVAAASAIGSFMTDEMEKEGYSREFSAAVNITASTTGLTIPPSNVLIVYSLASGGVSIAALFLAGYIPGILTGVFLMIVSAVWAKRKGFPTGKRSSLKQVATSFVQAFPSLLLLVVVIGGIVAGIFTATEASAVAVLYCLLLTWVYKEISLKELPTVFLDSVGTTAIVMLLIGTSMSMSWIMAYENIPQNITAALLSVSDSKFVVLLIINLILLFVGVFMDMTPAVVGIAGTTIQEVVRPLMPLFIAMLVALMLVTYVPELSLWLPRMFGF